MTDRTHQSGIEQSRWRDVQLIGFSRKRQLLRYGLYLYTAMVFVFLWVPLIGVIFLSFAENSLTILPFQGFTLSHYGETFADEKLMQSFVRSVLIATPAATIATVFGVLASFGLVRYDFPSKELFRVFVVLPMIIPGIILGVALLIFFKLFNMELGYLSTLLTHSVYGLPFVMLTVTARLYTFDEALEESARDLGADTFETFVDITFPILAPAIGAGFLFAWIRSFEDFIRAFFVSGSTSVLTTAMYGLIKFGFAFKLNTMSTIIIVLIGLALAIAMNIGNVTQYVTGSDQP